MMRLTLLCELLNTQAKVSQPFVDKICKLLFRLEGEAKGASYGIEHKQSTLVDKNGNPLMLTFDNSNAQREYELNSLTPLAIERESEAVQELERMYREHGVTSKAKLRFVTKSGKALLRGINFGAVINEKSLRMFQDALVMLAKLAIKLSAQL